MAMNTQQRQMMKVQEVILDSYCGTSKQLAKKHENMCLVPITSYLKTVMYYYLIALGVDLSQHCLKKDVSSVLCNEIK